MEKFVSAKNLKGREKIIFSSLHYCKDLRIYVSFKHCFSIFSEFDAVWLYFLSSKYSFKFTLCQLFFFS